MAKLCIIPARGGSKRIPRKNIKSFLGQPIIAYSIQTALDSGLFDEVMVSTDDEEIAEVARKYGAKIPFMRNAENANDFATTLSVIEEVLETYRKQGKEFETVCCLYPTAPFVTQDILKQALNKLQAGSYDSVFPVVRYSFPIQRALVERDGRIEMMDRSHVHTRSQDLEPTFHDAGQFYWFISAPVIAKGKLYTDNSSFIEIRELEAQDIDNETDWKLAELKYQLKNG